MKAIKIIGIGLGAIIAIALIGVAFMSPKSHMERSIVINASPALVFQQLTNYKNFNTWSPWAAMDPSAKYTFEGPEAGPGTKMSWVGDESKVGSGSQWIIEQEENRRVKSGMQFGGMEGTYFAEFILEPVEGGTQVTWTYDGDVSGTGMMNASFGKLFGLMTDAMLGPQYEDGLKRLKEMVESMPTSHPAPSDSTNASNSAQ